MLGDKKMNRIKSFVTVFAFALLVMSLPVVASAQWGGNNRNGGYGNGGYGNGNGGYYNNEQLKSTVKRLKNDSKDLARFIDRELDRNRNNGGWGNWGRGNNNSQLKNLANDFKRAADRLEGRFDSRDLYKSQSEAQDVLSIANQLDRELRRSRMSYDIQNYWNNIQNQLDQISSAYRYNNNNNNNRGRGNGRWGDWRNKFPF